MTNRFELNLGNVSTFVPPDAVYPGLPVDEDALHELLTGLSRDDTLLMCARINAMITGFSTQGDAERQQEACGWICNQHRLQRLDAFARQRGGLERVVVFFRGQLLEMMRQTALHCRNLPGDGETFTDERIRDRFFQAVLIAGTLWGDRIYGNRLWSLFSDYVPRVLPDFADRFAAATGLTLEQYLICVGAITAYTVANRAFRTVNFGATTAFDTVFPVYLELESMTPEDLARAAPGLPATGFRALRERPILRTPGGLSAVLDPAIYSETLTIGPLFHLVADKRRANELFGHFGRAFERYAIDILRRMYPVGSGLLAQRLLTNVEGRNAAGGGFEIDAALDDVTEVVLFEIKAASLREDSLLDASGEEFILQLRRKYGVLQADCSAGERAKGAAQLAKIVGAIARREWVGPSGEFAKQ
jgi:hypothetical protein